MTPYNVGILGATGMVGQRLLTLLEGHPWFRVQALAASERSVGRRYADATRWSLPGDPPESVRDTVVRACSPDDLDDCDLVLSGLDTGIAREVEPQFAGSGFAVISNSSAFRQGDDVPLLIPEVNADHLGLLARQRGRTGGGYIVTNPNCSVTGLAVVLAPLHRAFEVRRVVVVTLQAISGAGTEGPRALELLDNVTPYIPGEEDKLEHELAKLLGVERDGTIERAAITVSAHCHRVATLDGHLEAVSLELGRPADVGAVVEVLRGFRAAAPANALPSAPALPISVRDEPDRPQPRLDRDCGRGMTVVVGRVRPCPVLGLKLELLSHNTIRGAAGGTVLNAELLAARELLPRRSGGRRGT